MSAKVIIRQDRDRAHPFEDDALFHVTPVVLNWNLLGFNLHMRDWFLGSFDEKEEAINEIDKINSCTDDFHFVSGYCEYD